jgi:hypothetical protein
MQTADHVCDSARNENRVAKSKRKHEYSKVERAVIAQSVCSLCYGLDDRGCRFRFPAGAGNFSLHHRVQNGSGAHPASYPMATRGSFPGCKATGREADHSPPSSATVKE